MSHLYFKMKQFIANIRKETLGQRVTSSFDKTKNNFQQQSCFHLRNI